MTPQGPFSAFYMNNYNSVDKGKCDSCGHDCHCDGTCSEKTGDENCKCTSCKCDRYTGYGAT